jgi:hypothetical protein
MTDELTPQERLLRSEGEALLREVSKGKPSALVGVDGQPLKITVEPPAVSDDPAAAKAKALAAAKKRVADNADKINALLKENPEAQECSAAVLVAWRLLYWGIQELGTHEGMTNEFLTQVSDSMRASVVSSGYSIADLQADLKHKVLPFLQDRVRHYKAAQGKREKKIAAINRSLGGKGIALPCQSLRALFPKKPFAPGSLLVLHGNREALRAALKLCSFEHMLKNGGQPYYLSSVDGETEGDWAHLIMPPAWWSNAASELAKLAEVLAPVVEAETALVVIEDLELLFMADGQERPPLERKSKALARLYQWAVENLTAVVVGDNTGEDVPDERLYGQLPHAAVALQELDGVRHVVIGNDPLIVRK